MEPDATPMSAGSLDIQADCVIFVSVQRVFWVINLVCGRI